ncbi:hypothetical protein [Streptomyces adustus]|uniref:hypothetical protein n=1 Tax=Streptomyces adustus TaxID=1609272 RepID=UPI003723572F
MTAGWCSRTARAAVFAAVCVLLAALGHVMMSGSYVPGRVLAAAVVVTGAAGWCLTGRERGLPLVVTTVVAAQTALHAAFALAQSTRTDMTATMNMDAGMGMGGMDMGSMSSMSSMPSMPSMDPMDRMGSMGHVDRMVHMDHIDHIDHVDRMGQFLGGDHLMGGGSSAYGMFGAHLLAALLCGLWLAYGEKAVFRILRTVAGRLAAPLRLLLALPAPADRPRLGVGRPRSDRAPRLLLLVHAITSRGPPAGTAAA